MAKGTALTSIERRKKLQQGFPVRTEAGEIAIREKALKKAEAERKKKRKAAAKAEMPTREEISAADMEQVTTRLDAEAFGNVRRGRGR